MERLMRPWVALILAFLASPRLGNCIDDCATECFGAYQESQITGTVTCEIVRNASKCYEQNMEACDNQNNGFFPNSIFVGLVAEDCARLECRCGEEDESTATPPLDCPSVPEKYVVNPAMPMSSAGIPSNTHALDCSMTSASPLQQCSLFMDSQLRAFWSYRRGLETCSLPGAWFLLDHQSLSVGVEGSSLSPGYNHTRLTRVNVTFHPHACNPISRTYTASNTAPLESEFTPPLQENSTTSSSPPLQLMVGEDGSVVTLTANWLNTIIIIRRYAEFLSVTLHTPPEIASESEGLCTGCPSHLYLNITSINDQVSSFCPNESNSVIHNCFDHAGVANRQSLVFVKNNSYLDACVFSMYKIQTPEVLTMFNAIADDALLLEGRSTVAPTPPTSSSQSPRTSGQTVGQPEVTHSSSAAFHHHIQFSPLTLTITMAIMVAVLSIFR